MLKEFQVLMFQHVGEKFLPFVLPCCCCCRRHRPPPHPPATSLSLSSVQRRVAACELDSCTGLILLMHQSDRLQRSERGGHLGVNPPPLAAVKTAIPSQSLPHLLKEDFVIYGTWLRQNIIILCVVSFTRQKADMMGLGGLVLVSRPLFQGLRFVSDSEVFFTGSCLGLGPGRLWIFDQARSGQHCSDVMITSSVAVNALITIS